MVLRSVLSRAHTDEDKETSNENTDPSSVSVCKQTTEWESRDLPELVDDENDTSRATSSTQSESLLVRGHSVDSSHQTRIETVHCCPESALFQVSDRQVDLLETRYPIDMIM